MQQQAQAEGLTLLKSDNKTGYFGVYHHAIGKAKPYQARVSHGKRDMHLGYFATAEEAALCVARTPEAAQRAAAAPPQLQPSLPPPAPPAFARRTAPPPRR